MLVTLVLIRPLKPNGIAETLRFDIEHQRARKENMAIMAWIETSVSMIETWISATMAGTLTSTILAGIGYYGRNLDIGNFGRKRLLLPIMSIKPLLAFFFSTRENWVVVFASRRNNGNVACHLSKERELREWESVEGWENTRKEKWYTMNICGYFDFGYNWRCKRMSEQKKNSTWLNIGLELMRG